VHCKNVLNGGLLVLTHFVDFSLLDVFKTALLLAECRYIQKERETSRMQ